VSDPPKEPDPRPEAHPGPEAEPDPEVEPGDADLDISNEPEPDWAEAIRRGRKEHAERMRELLEAPREEPAETPGETAE